MKSESIFEKSPGNQPKNPSIRFLISIEDPSLLKIDPERFDTRFRNSLQDNNVQLSIIYRDNSEDSDSSFVMRTFESPCFVTEETPIWDVCFFSNPFIIETNVMTAQLPTHPTTNFNYYTKLHVFLKNRKDANFMEILGNPILFTFL